MFFLLKLLAPGSAQDSLPKEIIQFVYGYQKCLFDLADRYGGHGVLQGAIIFTRHNWEYGINFQYLFGDVVKEDVLARLRSPDGGLIGEDHQLAQVGLRQRGMLFGISAGKAFPTRGPASLVLSIQPGWLMHWIRFQNPGQNFAPIRGDYRYGYDRLSSGFAITEQVAYRYLSKNRLINFELGIQFTQGFTKLKRNTQFDFPEISTRQRFDGLIGIQAKWILPIYRKRDADSIYY